MITPHVYEGLGVKPLAYDLILGQGFVSSRAAL